jgi:hypothetical protein
VRRRTEPRDAAAHGVRRRARTSANVTTRTANSCLSHRFSGTSRAAGKIMVASSPSSRSITVTVRPRDGIPRAVETILGGMLELMIHSVEGLRDLFGRLSLR